MSASPGEERMAPVLRNELQQQLQEATAAEPQPQAEDEGYDLEGEEAAPSSSRRGARPPGYSRKARSLGLLCENFLSKYGREAGYVINVDTAAKELGVERRRIYDILNVLHSLDVTEKRMKSQYVWKGIARLPAFLDELHKEAAAELAAETLAPGAVETDARSEKSMVRLTRRFLQLFLLSQPATLPLEFAAKALLGESNETGQMKSKIRRLYDIANILCALGMIEKAGAEDGCKGGFRWLGTEGMMARSSAAASAAAALLADEAVGAVPGTTALLLADAGVMPMFGAGVPLPPMVFPAMAPLEPATHADTSNGAAQKRQRTEQAVASSDTQQQPQPGYAEAAAMPHAGTTGPSSHPLKRFMEMQGKAEAGGGGAAGGEGQVELGNPALWGQTAWPMNPAVAAGMYGTFAWPTPFPGMEASVSGEPAAATSAIPFPVPFPGVFSVPQQLTADGAPVTDAAAAAFLAARGAGGGHAQGEPPPGVGEGSRGGVEGDSPLQAYAANMQQAYALHYANCYASWMRTQEQAGAGGDAPALELPAQEVAGEFPDVLPMLAPPEQQQQPEQDVQTESPQTMAR